MFTNRIIWMVVVVFGSWNAAWGQSPLWREMSARFPDASAVKLENTVTLHILQEGDSLRCYSEVKERVLFLKDQAAGYARQRVFGSHFSQVSDLKAKTEVWNGNRYKDVDVTDFKKRYDEDSYVFYDDSYFYSFAYPSVAAGNIAELTYNVHFRDPRILDNHAFGSGIPEMVSKFVVRTSANVALNNEVFNNEKQSVGFRQYQKGAYKFYEWKAENLPGLVGESKAPSWRYLLPTVLVNIKSINNGSKPRQILAGTDDLYKWYHSFLTRMDSTRSDSLAVLVNSLRRKSKDEIDYAKKTLYWVQNNINYIAFEDGMRGFVPHSGGYVFEKRYGDCKDMANILVTMLRMGGAEAYHAWIGTRDLPFRYSEFATPMATNHMIAAFRDKAGQWYFLDGTSKFTHFGLPSSMIQGKEALVGKSSSEFEVREVPVIPAEQSKMMDTVNITLSGSAIKGTGRASLFGFQKVNASYELNKVNEVVKKANLVEILRKGSNKFVLENWKINGLEDQDKPLVIDYKFNVDSYVQSVAGEIFVNLCLDKPFYNESIKKERQISIESDYMYQQTHVYHLQIPEGYEVAYIPQGQEHHGKTISFKFEWTTQPGVITLRQTVAKTFLLLNQADFGDWNAGVGKLSEFYKESVVLKKKG